MTITNNAWARLRSVVFYIGHVLVMTLFVKSALAWSG
jgi:uncharacterized MAPEG superfamily protein